MPKNADSIADFCLEESFDGVSTTTLTNRSPVVLPLKDPAPKSRNLNIFPVCVSGGILSNTFLDRVGISISAPRIAWSTLIGTSQYR